MKTLDCTPFTEEQFQQLAMYKARGHAWVDIAQYLKLPVEQIQRVAWTHEKQWERTLTKAERNVARETLGEVIDTLRKDMRYAEPKLRPTIANSLTRAIKQQQEFAPKKHRRERPAPPVMVPTPTPTTEVPIVVPPTPPPPTSTQEVPRTPGVLAHLKAAVASFLGLLFLVWTLFCACARPTPLAEPYVVARSEPVTEGVATLVLTPEGPTVMVVEDGGQPPWWLERPGWERDT